MVDGTEGKKSGRVWWAIAGTSALVGLVLAADSALRSSASYDEVTYLRVAADWWRTGNEDAITRMGSPVLFWKIQQAVPLWCLDRAGFGGIIADPERSQAILLPLVRLACLPIWLVALGLTAWWARMAYGPRAMAMAAALFATSPNLLAHAPLATMETPLIACSAGMFLLFWRFLKYRERWAFASSAVVGGLALSCKYTTILLPPIFGLVWWVERRGEPALRIVARTRRVALGMLAYLAILAASNLAFTGFATTPLSPNSGTHASIDALVPNRWRAVVTRVVETPVPRELAGFVVQTQLQARGGSSYLFGERRDRGWWYYYIVALAVKVPPSLWLLVVGRLAMQARVDKGRDLLMPIAIAAYLAITAIASTRNYGLRYLLPMAPVAIVWLSAMAEAGRPWTLIVVAGLIGQAAAVATIHPGELSYFPGWVGGPAGGRHILADSNLDWGQGLKGLARLQEDRPEFRDLTLYYFGETDPANYGVAGTCHVIDASSYHPDLPPRLEASTKYLAVSSSLQFGPWGPDGYFERLGGVRPVLLPRDATIAIYRVEDLRRIGMD